MAQSQGFSCDRIGCDNFAQAPQGRMPDGWMQLQIADHDGRLHDALHFCSNKCGALQLIIRAQELDGVKVSTRMILTDEQREVRAEQGRRSGKKRKHRRGEHDDLRDVECPLCQEDMKAEDKAAGAPVE